LCTMKRKLYVYTAPSAGKKHRRFYMTSENEQNTNFKITVEEVIEHEDGSATVVFEASDEFYDWWLKEEGLEEFDQTRFQEWFIKSVKAGLDIMEETNE